MIWEVTWKIYYSVFSSFFCKIFLGEWVFVCDFWFRNKTIWKVSFPIDLKWIYFQEMTDRDIYNLLPPAQSCNCILHVCKVSLHLLESNKNFYLYLQWN